MMLPANISISNARLPQTYENAKTALANCDRIHECQSWANKAEALASYAKMADDDTLRKLADRIQARAVRRCQELLKQYPKGHGGNRGQVNGSVDLPSRKQAALNAGLSQRQYDNAQAIGKIPDADFEAAIESENPPTISQLAIMARDTSLREARISKDRPAGFQAATNLIGTVERFAQFCSEHDAETIARAVMPHEAKQVREHVSRIDSWMDVFVVNLKD